jgi:membrane-associated phospholipid phosphatase
VSEDVPLIGLAVCCFVASAALGAYVAHREFTKFDIETFAFRGHATQLAIFFTRCGYWPTLTAIGFVLCAGEFALRGEAAFGIALSATQLLSQGTANVMKELLRRTRPDDWLYHQELGFSFPSGHATTAVVFFGGLVMLAAGLPVSPELRLAAVILPAIFVAGIPWSRLALSAHYATDVLGGLLLGGGWLALMTAFLHHVPEARFL